MAITSVKTQDIATALEEVLESVDGLRAYRFVPDNFRPPGAVIALPAISYADPDAPFCTAQWDFPISIIVGRNNDRAAQDLLSRLVSEVVVVVDAAEIPDLFSVEVISATPASVQVSGQDLPAYVVHVRVRA